MNRQSIIERAREVIRHPDMPLRLLDTSLHPTPPDHSFFFAGVIDGEARYVADWRLYAIDTIFEAFWTRGDREALEAAIQLLGDPDRYSEAAAMLLECVNLGILVLEDLKRVENALAALLAANPASGDDFTVMELVREVEDAISDSE